jgi:hypothetical protein
MAGNVEALCSVLSDAHTRCLEAREFLQKGECDGAIGALLDTDRVLGEVKALYDAILVLHRRKTI